MIILIIFILQFLDELGVVNLELKNRFSKFYFLLLWFNELELGWGFLFESEGVFLFEFCIFLEKPFIVLFGL